MRLCPQSRLDHKDVAPPDVRSVIRWFRTSASTDRGVMLCQ